MSQQFEALGEQTKHLEIAVKYTDGDLDKAKEMVSKQFLDIEVVKVKYLASDGTLSGLLLSFFNMNKFYISHTESVQIKSSKIFDKIRIFDGWKIIYTDLISFRSGEEVDDTTDLNNHLLDAFIECDLFAAIEEKNLDELSRTVQDILSKHFEQSIKVVVELEPSSSLEMEIEGISFDVPDMEEQVEEETSSPEPVVEQDLQEKEIEKQADHIIPGTLIVSPVKGKYLNDVGIGEKVMVRLTGKDPVTNKILTILNARDKEGNIQPIKGRMKSKVPLEKSGYTLYVLVAKAVLVKIIEEENVKIQMEQPVENNSSDGSDTNIVVFMGAIVALILIIGVIIFALIG